MKVKELTTIPVTLCLVYTKGISLDIARVSYNTNSYSLFHSLLSLYRLLYLRLTDIGLCLSFTDLGLLPLVALGLLQVAFSLPEVYWQWFTVFTSPRQLQDMMKM